ncbi:MAG: ATP-binding protein [Bernardetiaceae bacterium]
MWGLCCLLLFNGTTSGQTHRSRIYTEADGLLSGNILEIAQAADGAIWMATPLGVSRYDGVHWKHFDSQQYGLPRNAFQQMAVLPDTSVWVSGYRNDTLCVIRYKSGQWQPLPLPPQTGITLSNCHLTLWQKGQETRISVANHQAHTYTSSTQSWTSYDLPTQEVIDLSHDPEGKLWLSCREGVFRQSDQGWVPALPQTWYLPNMDSLVYRIRFAGSDTRPYLLASNWIGRLHPDSLQVLFRDDFNPRFLHSSYTHLSVNPRGKIVFSRRSRAHELKGDQAYPIHFEGDDVFGWFEDILQDQEDNLWLATNRGCIKVSPLYLESYDHRNGLPEREVSAILTDGDRFFLGGNKSAARWQAGRFVALSVPDLPPAQNTRILNILKDSLGTTYWVANYAGLGILPRDASDIRWLSPEVLGIPYVEEAFFFRGQLYLTNGQFIYRYEGERKATFVHRASSRIRKVVALGQDSLCLIADNLLRFDGETSHLLYPLASGYRMAIYGACRWRGRILVATLQGLQEVKDGRIIPTRVAGRSIEQAVFALLADKSGGLWVGTSNGTFHLQDQQWQYYDRLNGLIGTESNRNALTEDEQGRIWIGTDKGVSLYDPRQVRIPEHQPRLSLPDIQTNKGNVFSGQAPLVLPADENTLDIAFVGISFLDERAINYRYRLLGQHQYWQYLPNNAQTNARYINLAPGNYRFEVQTRIQGRPWTASVYSAPLTIESPWYQSPIFYLGLMLALVALGFLVNAWITKEKNQQYLERKVQEKTQQIMDSQEELRIANQELDRFVSNVSHDLKAPLNSLQGLVELIELAPSEQERKQFLELIKKNTQRLRDFLDELIAYARNQRTARQRVPIRWAEQLNACISTLRYGPEAQAVDIQQQVEERGVFISDIERINIIINNLLSNAIRYRRRDVPSWIRITLVSDARQAVLTVADNGIGIAPEKLPHIFEMFEKGGQQRAGSSGLGLYIVQETLQRLGGSVSVESKVGEGTRFRVVIPSDQQTD